ncbi:MAG: LON peptidase substrate-binding domain-containing protein, partial [Pseudomonadota bacterium]
MAIKSYRKASDLPGIIPVFPLTGALLFPRWTLPLNIFEPRYLNMIDDAMANDRLLGMIQSVSDGKADRLASVGCVGRLTSYSETDDGRYLIVLTGISRFRVIEELEVNTPYRQVSADWADFGHDLVA